MNSIFVVERNIVLRELISDMLRADGHTVIVAADTIEALLIVDALKHELDLILIDVEMTPISGFEFVKRMTLDNIRIPVLFMSSYPGIAGVIAATLGPRAVIEKPFTAPELRKNVGMILASSEEGSCQDLPDGAKAA